MDAKEQQENFNAFEEQRRRGRMDGGEMKRFRYDLIQDGLIVASVDAPTKEQAQQEIRHYAMMYEQDGPVEIKEKSDGR